MNVRKKSLVVLFVLFFIAIGCGIFTMFKPAIASNGADIVITNDFTVISSIEDGNQLDMMNIYDYHNVSRATTSSEAGYGLIPSSTFSTSVNDTTGDGYVTYKVEADEGYTIKDFSATISALISHTDQPGYIHKDKTNVRVYVATDKLAFSEVFDQQVTNGYKGWKNSADSSENRLANTTTNELDLSSYVAGAKVVYVKIDLVHLTLSELSDANDDAVPAPTRLGVSLHKVELEATQTPSNAVIKTISFTDDYTSNTKIDESTNIVEKANLLNYPDWHGALPTSSTSWAAYLMTDNAYAIYKLSAEEGSIIKNPSVNISLGLATSSGLYNWWDGNMDNANVYIDVSTDGGQTYTQAYDVLNDQTLYKEISDGTKVNPFKAGQYDSNGNRLTSNADVYNNVSPTISLSTYSGTEIYIRVRIKHPTSANVHSSFATNGVTMGRIAVQYHGITISAEQESLPVVEPIIDNTGKFVIEDNFMNLEQGVTAWQQERKVNGLTTYNYGSTVNGVIPASTWGANVSAKTGYMIYEIPLNGNNVIAGLSALTLDYVGSFSGNRYTADLVVLTSFDGLDYSEFYRMTDENALPSITTEISKSVDLTSIVTDENAIGKDTLYVKITIEHQEVENVALGNLAVRLLSVKFTGKQNFTMQKGASIRIGNDGNGIKFTTLIDKVAYQKLIDGGYTLSFGTFIMPKDYITTYNADISYETVFGDNAKYCWGGEVAGKTEILHRTALINENFLENYHSITYSIVNIKEDNLNREFIGRGYVKCVKDGKIEYIFADYTDNDIDENSRTMVTIAQKALDDSSSVNMSYNLRQQYLNKLKGTEVSYTVKHVYFSGNGNDISKITIETKTATIGSVVSLAASTTSEYTAVDSYSTKSNDYESLVTSTVLADGSLVLVQYYIANA